MTTTPKHILFVLPSFAGGGAERVALALLRGIDPVRFTVSLIVLNGQGPLTNLVPKHIPLTDLATPRLRRAFPGLISEIRKERPDVVFSTLGYVNLALLAVRLLLPRQTRILVREANMPSLSLPATSHPTLYQLAYRLLYPLADGVICTSEKMADEIRKDFSVSPVRVFLLANPVDEAALRSSATPTVRASGDGLRLVAAGRLTYQKGFDRLINWMVNLDPSTHLTILGEGPERAKLQEQTKRLGLENRVAFAGFCDSPWSYFAGADAFVLPSRWEGLPNAALEALACGASVVATPESGGIVEIASDAIPGAVSVVEAGASFLSALAALSPKHPKNSTPCPSLLPGRFVAATVVREFENILMRI